jgi:hypothetical protein
MSVAFSPLQRRALAALGYVVVAARAGGAASAPRLADRGVPPKVRGGLDRWVGGLWGDWPAPPGADGEAAFKRALWRRIRDWRRGD